MAGAYAILDALAGLVDAPIAMAAAIVDGDVVEEAYDFSKEESRFEFGSLTKTMTGEVLRALVAANTIRLDDSIGTWLDAGPNAAITVEQLARHASGLPRIAPNALDHDGFDPTDPYAAYTPELAEEGLRAASRSEDSEYSNFGYQLLGLCLERAAGTPLTELFAAHVFEPFGLVTATVNPGPNQVQGYRSEQPVPAWRCVLPGPCGVCGTLADLVAWGRSVIGDPNLAWGRYEGDVVWHNGGTYGAHAALFVHPPSRRLAATLIATNDLDHVDEATLIACQGGDAFTTRPAPVGDGFDAPAVAFFELLVAQDWEQARARMGEQCRAALTPERLAAAWHEVMSPRGDYRATTPQAAVRRGETVEVAVALSFADGEGKGIVNFDADGQVVGVRIA